jgi:phage baseplate assembly protein W
VATNNIQFPLTKGTDGYFALTQTTLDTIKQNLIITMATDENERMVNCQIGSRFRKFLFDPDVRNVKLKAENEANRVFSTWFPQLKITKLDIQVLDDTSTNRGMIQINLEYTLKALQSISDSVSVIIG